MCKFEVYHPSMAAPSVKTLKLAEGRVSSPFAVPADAGLRRRVGEAGGWAGLSRYNI